MFRDYSGTIAIENGRSKIRVPRRKTGSTSREFLSLKKLMWKTIGAMLLVTLAIGITSTIWYGWQIQMALDQIGSSKVSNNTMLNENRLLIVQRDLMLTQENMEEAAQKLGLGTPSKNQVRHP